MAVVSGDSVTFRLDGEVTIGKLSDVFARFSAVLEELQRDQHARVTWIVADLGYGSAMATARAVPLDDESAGLIPGMCDTYLAAARQVSRGEVDNDRPLLRLVRDLTVLADDGNRVVLETADDDVIFAAPLPEPPGPVDTGLVQTTKSLGTVRGRVETLSHRKELRFTLYELATDGPVSCYLRPDHEDLMRDAWGRVADVTGTVTRDALTGRPLSVRQVSAVKVAEEGDAMGFLQARGAIGGTEPAERVIRRIRDAS